MKKNNFEYPIVVFAADTLYTARDEKDILICTKTALKRGFYREMIIIDSKGFQYNIKDAKKTKGYGTFFGYNIFLNQRIEIELIFDNKEFIKINLEQLKEKVVNNFQKAGLWDSGDNLRDVIKKIREMCSIKDLIVYLSLLYYGEQQ